MQFKTMFSLLLSIFIFVSCQSAFPQTNEKTQNNQPHIVDGRYADTEDKSAIIEIKGNQFIMHYKGVTLTDDSIFIFHILDTIRINDQIYSNGPYLQIENNELTLQFHIDTWNYESITLMYLPRGNITTYRRLE